MVFLTGQSRLRTMACFVLLGVAGAPALAQAQSPKVAEGQKLAKSVNPALAEFMRA